jgi:hypothetical protein
MVTCVQTAAASQSAIASRSAVPSHNLWRGGLRSRMANCPNCGAELGWVNWLDPGWPVFGCSNCPHPSGAGASALPAQTEAAPPTPPQPPSRWTILIPFTGTGPRLRLQAGALRKIRGSFQKDCMAATSSPIPPADQATTDLDQATLIRKQPPARRATATSPAALGLDDVPQWLGWLAILITLTTIGLLIYCIWAYRPGRRDGG